MLHRLSRTVVFIELFDIVEDLFEYNESSKRPSNSFRCFSFDRGRIP